MTGKEEQYRKINNEYTQLSYIFYESMRPKSKRYYKKDLNKQIRKLIRSLTVLEKM